MADSVAAFRTSSGGLGQGAHLSPSLQPVRALHSSNEADTFTSTNADATPASSSPVRPTAMRDHQVGRETTLLRPPVVLEPDHVEQQGHAGHADAMGGTEDAGAQTEVVVAEKLAQDVHRPCRQQPTSRPLGGSCAITAAAAGWASPAMVNPLGSLIGNVAAVFRAGTASATAGARDPDMGRTRGAFARNTTGRLLLRWLELENFKSFHGKHVVGPLSNCVAIAGPNGAGKSNLIDAIAFALGVNARQLRCVRLVDLINVSRSPEAAEDEIGAAEEEREGADITAGGDVRGASATVALHFVSADAARGGGHTASSPPAAEAERFSATRTFRRTLTRGGIDSYFIDGEAVTPSAYRDSLQRDCSCSVYTLQAMLMFQGQIDAVAVKAPRELARLFEEISGSALYAEPYEAAQAAMRKAREEAQRLFCRSSELQQELKVLRKQKAEADNYLRQKSQQVHLQEELYLFNFFMIERIQTLEKDQQKHAEQRQLKHHEQLERLLLEAQEADRGRITKEVELQQVKEKLARVVRHSHERRGSYMAMVERARFREQQKEDVRRQLAKVTAQTEELLEYEQKLLQQYVRAEERIREAEARKEAAEQRYVSAQQQQDSLQQQRLTPEQQELLRRLEISWQEHHALQQQRVAARQLQLKALRSSLDLLLQEERELVRSESTAQELCTETAAKAAAVQEELQEVLARAHSVKEGRDELHNRVATLEEQRHSLKLQEEELQQQLAQDRNLALDVRRVAHEREVCEQLKRHISHTGVHAAALECCQPLNKRLTVAVAAALGERATSIIVDTHELATRCIDYLKTMRLGSREFLPLEALRVRYGGIRRAPAEGSALAQWRQEGFLVDEEDEADAGGDDILPPPPVDELPPGCRWAVDCVVFEDKLRPAFEFLLSDCVIVPTLTVAQQLRYGHSDLPAAAAPGAAVPRSNGLQRYRMVTLEGEKLLRSGVIAFETGGFVARLAARLESQQHQRHADRLRDVQDQLETLEVTETTNSAKLLQCTAAFAALHRQSVQLQAKARVWSDQTEEKHRALLQLQQQLHQQQQRVAALREDIRIKQQQVDEMQSNLQKFHQHHFAPLDRSVGRKHVWQEERRSQQLLEQYRAEAASLGKQRQELQAELADCRDRLQQLQQKKEQLTGAIYEERLQQEEQRLLQQLQMTEEEMAQADHQRESVAAEYKRIEDELRCHAESLQKTRERVEACQAEQRRLVRVAAAAEARRQQAVGEQQRLLEEIVHQDIRLPLSVGSWRDVRAAVLGEAAAAEDRIAAASDETEREHVEPAGNATSAEDEASEEEPEKRRRRCGRFTETGRRSSNRSPSSTGDVSLENPDKGGEEDSNSLMHVDAEIPACGLEEECNRDEGGPCDVEQRFHFDFTGLPVDKRQHVSHRVQQGLISVLDEEKAKYQQQLQQQAVLLRKLQPNLKADEQQQKLQQELHELEQQREARRGTAVAAEQELQQLQCCRSTLFLRCFHHCRAAVDYFFRELTAVGAADGSSSETEENATTRDGTSFPTAAPATATKFVRSAAERAEAADPDEQARTPVAVSGVKQHQVVARASILDSLQRHSSGKHSRERGRSGALEKVGGRAFLELEPLSSDNADAAAVPSREDEAFLCGVSLHCMPPAKRIMPLQMLSGGERAAAAVSLLLALLSFLPHVPFLLLDEVDAALDYSRRKALARVLHAVGQQLQVVFISLKDQMYASASMVVGVVVERPLGRSRCFFLDLLPYRKKRNDRRATNSRSPRGAAAAVAGLAVAATPTRTRSSSHDIAVESSGVAPRYDAFPRDSGRSIDTVYSNSSNTGTGSSLFSSRSNTLGQSRSNFIRRSSSVVPSVKPHVPANERETTLPPYQQKVSLLPQQL